MSAAAEPVPAARRRVVAPRLHAQRLRLDRAAVHVRHAGVAQGHEGARPPPAPRARRPARRSRPSSATCRSRRARRRSRPRTASTSTTSTSRRAWPRSCPASRRRSTATRASTPGRRSAPARAAPAIVRQHNSLSFDTNVHLHGGYVPAAHDGHPMDVIAPGARVRLHVPERAGRGVPLVPRPRPRPHRAHALLRAGRHATCSHDEREEELELPQGEYDVPLVLADHAFNKDGSFRYAENVDLGFRGDTILVNGAVSPRMARPAAALPAALPQRLQRALLRPQARQRAPDAADRQRRRPARARRSRARASRCTRPSGSRC